MHAQWRRSILSGGLAFAMLLLSGCASGREFWTYVVEPPLEKPAAREPGTVAGEPSSPQVIQVAYSDGATSTTVQVPMISSGQTVVIDHKSRPAGEAIALAPLAPGPADKGLEESYLKSGHAVSAKSAPVSIVKTQGMVKKLVKQGQFSVALEYLEQLLQRYPQHAESLRAKGSILLKMGERKAALEAYRKSQDIEPNPQVLQQIRELERTTRD